jgi:hypothetical protein
MKDQAVELLAMDVVLLPETSISVACIDYSRQLAEIYDSEIRLNKHDCLPHISLSMGILRRNKIDELSVEIAKTVGECCNLKLEAVAVESGEDEGRSVSLQLAKGRELVSLHEAVMTITSQYFSHDVSGQMFFDELNVNQTSLNWVADYPETSAYKNWEPHITLGYGKALSEIEIRGTFSVKALALCHLGNHCTCREVLFEIAMGG